MNWIFYILVGISLLIGIGAFFLFHTKNTEIPKNLDEFELRVKNTVGEEALFKLHTELALYIMNENLQYGWLPCYNDRAKQLLNEVRKKLGMNEL